MSEQSPEPLPLEFCNFVSDVRYEVQNYISPSLTLLLKELLHANDRQGFEDLGQKYFRYWDSINYISNHYQEYNSYDKDMSVISLIVQKKELLSDIEVKKNNLNDPVHQAKLNAQKISRFQSILKYNFIKKCPLSIKSPLVGS
jgi:hypothetical protein